MLGAIIAIAAVITTTSATKAMHIDWRWLVHHNVGNLWGFIPKAILTEGFRT